MDWAHAGLLEKDLKTNLSIGKSVWRIAHRLSDKALQSGLVWIHQDLGDSAGHPERRRKILGPQRTSKNHRKYRESTLNQREPT